VKWFVSQLGLLTVVAVAAAAQEAPAPPAPGPPAAPVSGVWSPRNVTATPEHNEWNPRFSPDGRSLSFERRDGSAQALFIVGAGDPSSQPQRVTSRAPEGPASAEEMLLGGGAVDDSFNAQLSFFPGTDRFIFTGNASTGIYRLYEGRLGMSDTRPVTEASKEDGHPAVSPDGRFLAYVSARVGIGKLFLRDLATGVERQLTTGDEVDLFPAWSPNSRALAFTSGNNDNHDVYLIPDVTVPDAQPLQLTRWNFDDLRPIFSPDGLSIAFYSNFSPSGEEKEWSIVVVPADGSGPAKGVALTRLVVATNVTKDVEVGPAWLNTGRRIVFARNLKDEWNPVFVVNVDSHAEQRLPLATRMNHDLACSRDGLLAFRAQIASWDDVFVVPMQEQPE